MGQSEFSSKQILQLRSCKEYTPCILGSGLHTATSEAIVCPGHHEGGSFALQHCSILLSDLSLTISLLEFSKEVGCRMYSSIKNEDGHGVVLSSFSHEHRSPTSLPAGSNAFANLLNQAG